MANDLSANPWRLDTSVTPGPLYNAPVKIDNIVWADAAPSQTLTINDVNGKEIITASTPAGFTGGTWNFGKIGWVRGIGTVTVPSGGVVSVTVGAGK